MTRDGFKAWLWYGTAVLFGTVLLVLLYDLKADVTTSLDSAQTAIAEANQAIATINDKLPKIVAAVEAGSETLAGLANDVELVKSIAGIGSDQADQAIVGLASYAREIQKVLEKEGGGKGAVIVVEEIFGSDLKQVGTVEEFLVGLNREMLLILATANSRQEILYRTCRTIPPRREPFSIRFPDSEAIDLEEFVRSHHSESAALPEYGVPLPP